MSLKNYQKIKERSKPLSTVSHKDLMDMGFPEHTSRDIIKQAKAIAVERFKESGAFSSNMVELNKSPFDNIRLNLAPAYIVEELLGFELFSKKKGT